MSNISQIIFITARRTQEIPGELAGI